MFRTRGGEIVNATMLEVFLLFSFLLLILMSADAEKLSKALSVQGKAKEIEAELARTKSELADAQGRLVILNHGEYRSPYKPPCPSSERYLIEVQIKDAAALSVKFTQANFGLSAGETVEVPLPHFGRFVSAKGIDTFSGKNNCKFRARLIDSPDATKLQYKAAYQNVSRFFYVIQE